MRIKSQISIMISFIIVLAGIFLTYSLGLWATESSKIPQKFNEVEFANEYDPADIRGSYTFSEISNLYSIPLKDLAVAFSVEESDASSFKCKELETIFANSSKEIGTGSVKMFVAFYLGLPYTMTEDTFLPNSAIEILMQTSNITKERIDYLHTHNVGNVQ